MQYLRAYQFLFDSPKWAMNLLLATVCMLIPVLGPLVLLGYIYELIETMHRRGGDQGYPEFNFDRFMMYLVRGAWPFLVQLIVLSPLIIVMIGFYVGVITTAAVLGDSAGPAVFVLGIVALVVLATALQLALGMVLVPMSLRAGLSQDFQAAFSMDFLRDFLARVWVELLLVQLFLLVSGAILSTIGVLLFCIGQYPAGALVSLAQGHLHYQLYELYLRRGGPPIPLKPEPPTAALAD